MSFVNNHELFRDGDDAPHDVQIARVIAAELIEALEYELGHPLSKVSEIAGDASAKA